MSSNKSICDSLQNTNDTRSFSDDFIFQGWITYLIGMGWMVLSVTVTGYYMLFRVHQYDRLKARSFALVLAGHLAGFVQLHTGAYNTLSVKGLPCFFNHSLSLLVVPMMVIPLTVKLLQFEKQVVLTNAAAPGLELEDDKLSSKNDEKSVFTFKKILVIMFGPDKRMKKKKLHVSTTVTGTQELYSISYNNYNNNEEGGGAPPLTNFEIRLWRFSASSYGALLTLILISTPFLIATGVSFMLVPPVFATMCTGCAIGYTHSYFIIGEGFVALLSFFYVIRRLRGLKDPFGIIKEGKMALLFGATPALLAFILASVDVRNDGFSWNIFVTIGMVLFSLCQGWFQVLLAQREASLIQWMHHKGVEIEEEVEENKKEDTVQPLVSIGNEAVGTSAAMSPQRHSNSRASLRFSTGLNYSELLQMILSDPLLKNSFHAHLCEEHGVEPLTFLDATDRWRAHFPNSTLEMRQTRARKIMKNFIGPRARFPIPLSNAQVDVLIRKTIKAESLTLDTFEGARLEMLKLLQFGPLVRFVRSEVWKGFIDDGVINMDVQQFQKTGRHSSAKSEGAVLFKPGKT